MAHMLAPRPKWRKVQESTDLLYTHPLPQPPSPPHSEFSQSSTCWPPREDRKGKNDSMQDQLAERDRHVARLQDMLKQEREKSSRLQSRITQQEAELRRREQQNIRLKERLSHLTERPRDRGAVMEILNPLPKVARKQELTFRASRADGRREEESLRLMLERREAELREAMKLRHSLTTLLHALRTDMEQSLKKTLPNAVVTEEQEEDPWILQTEKSLGDHVTGGVVQEWTHVQKKLRELQPQGCAMMGMDQDKLQAHLEEELAESKELIRVQQQLLQDSVNVALPSAISDSYYLEEWERLQDTWVELKRQRQSFERERKAFTDAAIRLGHERCAFEQQRASYLRLQFLSVSPLRTNFNENKRRESTALSISVPDHLSPNSSCPATPSSVESVADPLPDQRGVTTPTTPELYSALKLPYRSVRSPFQSQSWEGQAARVLFLPVENNKDRSF